MIVLPVFLKFSSPEVRCILYSVFTPASQHRNKLPVCIVHLFPLAKLMEDPGENVEELIEDLSWDEGAV